MYEGEGVKLGLFWVYCYIHKDHLPSCIAAKFNKSVNMIKEGNPEEKQRGSEMAERSEKIADLRQELLICFLSAQIISRVCVFSTGV